MSIDASGAKVKIGGWLIVVGVFLWASILAVCTNILFGLIAVATHQAVIPVPIINSLINLVLLVPMLLMFHQRKLAIVWWSIIYALYVVVDECYIQYRSIVAHSSTTFIGHVIAVVLEALLMFAVVMYFFKSKRVKRTFIR